MKQTLYQQAFVTIILDTAVPVIYEEWLGSVSPQEFKATLAKKLELFVQHKKQHPNLRWLVNLKGLKVGEEGQNWANHEFHSQLYSSGVRKIAFIVPEGTLYMLDNDQLSAHMDNAQQIELCYFDNMKEAKEWVKNIPLTEES